MIIHITYYKYKSYTILYYIHKGSEGIFLCKFCHAILGCLIKICLRTHSKNRFGYLNSEKYN